MTDVQAGQEAASGLDYGIQAHLRARARSHPAPRIGQHHEVRAAGERVGRRRGAIAIEL